MSKYFPWILVIGAGAAAIYFYSQWQEAQAEQTVYTTIGAVVTGALATVATFFLII